jgi:hypothetical protein
LSTFVCDTARRVCRVRSAPPSQDAPDLGMRRVNGQRFGAGAWRQVGAPPLREGRGTALPARDAASRAGAASRGLCVCRPTLLWSPTGRSVDKLRLPAVTRSQSGSSGRRPGFMPSRGPYSLPFKGREATPREARVLACLRKSPLEPWLPQHRARNPDSRSRFKRRGEAASALKHRPPRLSSGATTAPTGRTTERGAPSVLRSWSWSTTRRRRTWRQGAAESAACR